MIKLRNLIRELIAERLSYAELMAKSDPKRIERSTRIPTKSLIVQSLNDREAWKFSYKTPRSENTTGLRHQGFIYFFKESMAPGDDAMKLDCSVDCGCPDYRYRFSYANKQQDAGENGPNSLNKGFNYPSSINAGPGLCKHLLALKEYLHTKIEGEPVDEPVNKPTSQKPVALPAEPTPDKTPPEEPEEPEQPIDPTQTPDPDKEKELQAEPDQPNDDPTQTPQEPDQQEEPPVEEPNVNDKNKKKIRETALNKSEIGKILDHICKTKPVFVI